MGVLSSPRPTRLRAAVKRGPGLAPIDSLEIEQLREEAKRCRRLARSLGDVWTVSVLEAMACEYDDRASVIECGGLNQPSH